MLIRRMLFSRVSDSFLVSSIFFLSCFTGLVSSAVVTLDSVEIYKTHEWLKAKPTVYFQCKDEKKTELPDVKEAHVLYKFKGQESWQPLTEISSKKCKRCGFYEKDSINSDDIFDEWEICPDDFTSADGKYTHFKDKEINATFLCADCVLLGSHTASNSHSGGNGRNTVIVIMIALLVSIALIFGLVVAFKYWRKKKREQEQARFLKLFEDGDDIEDELGLGHII